MHSHDLRKYPIIDIFKIQPQYGLPFGKHHQLTWKKITSMDELFMEMLETSIDHNNNGSHKGCYANTIRFQPSCEFWEIKVLGRETKNSRNSLTP
jgi:hypothetical protein